MNEKCSLCNRDSKFKDSAGNPLCDSHYWNTRRVLRREEQNKRLSDIKEIKSRK